MNKQELIEKIEELETLGLISEHINKKEVLDLVEQLDEPEQVKIPQLVADWIEVAKSVYSLAGAMEYGSPGVNKWLENWDNQRIFALAWFFGYEVEKEKRYRVKMKNLDKRLNTLNQERTSKDFVFSELEENSLYVTKFTRKELEDAGFSEVFNSPLFEVEEVE
ncbi:hypothetical protein D8864_04890 [Streptococcus oralis]|jgi:hypothetical protein|uniref:DUF1642 domain-containing protein n=1 Tax=Streptococcus oralis TaxID=1303 RepID=UPI000FC165E5|nr:DUF1642 domain-containing protein [Streptococcus oralis]RSI61368.1 hypothetical protein D8864_04890 [Streptococcus oralis]